MIAENNGCHYLKRSLLTLLSLNIKIDSQGVGFNAYKVLRR